MRALVLLVLLQLVRAALALPTVAICVAIKDQAVDVREWIHYHRAIGGGTEDGSRAAPAPALVAAETSVDPTTLLPVAPTPQASANFTSGTRAAAPRCR